MKLLQVRMPSKLISRDQSLRKKESDNHSFNSDMIASQESLLEKLKTLQIQTMLTKTLHLLTVTLPHQETLELIMGSKVRKFPLLKVMKQRLNQKMARVVVMDLWETLKKSLLAMRPQEITISVIMKIFLKRKRGGQRESLSTDWLMENSNRKNLMKK